VEGKEIQEMKRKAYIVYTSLLIGTILVACGPAAKAPVSPSGGRIAFGSFLDLARSFEICVMNADGSGQTNLTNDPAADDRPAWSPDGTRIAFNSDRDGNSEIYVMNADGSGQTRLTNSLLADWAPAWSP
jgi:TolB protein